MADAATAPPKRTLGASAFAAVAARRPDHRAGARHGAVSGDGVADHARPSPLGAGGAESGQGTKAGRHRDAAQRRGRRSPSGRSASNGDGRQYRSLHHRAGRHPSSRVPGRATVPGRRLSDRLAVLRRQDREDSGAHSDVRRDRGPFHPSQGPGDRGRPAPAAGAERIAGDDPGNGIRRARSPIWWRPSWTRRRTRSRRSSRRSTSAPDWSGSRGCSRIGSRCFGCRRRSAGKPRPRSTPATARSCCASRWRPFSASSAKRMRESPPRSPNSRRRSPTRKCRRRSRTRRARNCAVCSACRKPPANTGWCGPISIGWSNCPGRFPRRRRSTSRRRAASSTRITSVSRRSSAGSSNIWPFASWRRAARRRSFASSDRPASARRRSASRSRAP